MWKVEHDSVADWRWGSERKDCNAPPPGGSWPGKLVYGLFKKYKYNIIKHNVLNNVV